MNINAKGTRGWGLLEGFLIKKRAGKANSFIKQKHRSGRILDVGCGSYPYFLSSTEFTQKYGIDPSVEIKAVRNKEINLTNTDVTKGKLTFKDNYFDVVTMLAVFEHLNYDKLNFVLKEIKRVLGKDGVFIITTPAPWSDKLLHFMALFGLISKEEIHEHKHHYDKNTIEKILIDAGFEKNKIRSGYFEMGLNMWLTAIK
jgi:SAM-dependent methyltransferase